MSWVFEHVRVPMTEAIVLSNRSMWQTGGNGAIVAIILVVTYLLLRTFVLQPMAK